MNRLAQYHAEKRHENAMRFLSNIHEENKANGLLTQSQIFAKIDKERSHNRGIQVGRVNSLPIFKAPRTPESQNVEAAMMDRVWKGEKAK